MSLSSLPLDLKRFRLEAGSARSSGDCSVVLSSPPKSFNFYKEMHVGFIDLIKGFFARSEANQQTLSDGKSDNYYLRGNIQDRGPCPALNALANQGYL